LRAPLPDRDAAKARARSKKFRYRLTNIKSLTDNLGHDKTHAYLKQFGQTWIVKGGRIYFEDT